MTTPMLMTHHPTEETLAAYVDDQLDSAARSEATEHLASCGECREIVLMAIAFQAEEAEKNVRQGTFGRPLLAVAALAVAASIAVIVIEPVWLVGPDADEVIASSQTVQRRASTGRLAGDSVYREAPPHDRGEPKNGFEGKARLYGTAVKLQDALLPPDPHAVGLTKLMLAKERSDFSAAVATLESAFGKARGKERDVVAINLAAALIENTYWSGTPAENYRRALDLSNDVLQRNPKSPEALWNRAVATSSLSGKNEAIRAWDDYLMVDPDSQWAKEALQKKAYLQSEF